MCDATTIFNEFPFFPSCLVLFHDDDNGNNNDLFIVSGIRKEETRHRNNNNDKSYIVQKKIVRFNNDDASDNVLIEWIDNNHDSEDEGEELKKNRWYQSDENEKLLKESLSMIGHLVLAGYYQGDDDIHCCIRGLEFKLPTKSSRLRRNRRLTARNAVFQQQQQQQQQHQIATIKQRNTTAATTNNDDNVPSTDNDHNNSSAERIAFVYANANSPSRKLAMILGAYDAKEALRIYNGEKESLSVLICRRLLALQNKKVSYMKRLKSSQGNNNNNSKCYSLIKKSSSHRRNRKSKCLYLDDIEKSLLSILGDDFSPPLMINNECRQKKQ